MLNKMNVTNGGARGKSVRPQQDAFEKKTIVIPTTKTYLQILARPPTQTVFI